MRRWRKTLTRLTRYASVSAISTTISLVTLGLLVGWGKVSAGWANVIATGVGTIPSFELNRRWVWAKRDRRSMTGEILPFCALSFVALGLSTLAVHEAATWAEGAGWSALGRTLAVEAASVATFGSLWVVQYVLLDRVLFRLRTAPLDQMAAVGPDEPSDQMAGVQ